MWFVIFVYLCVSLCIQLGSCACFHSNALKNELVSLFSLNVVAARVVFTVYAAAAAAAVMFSIVFH